MKIEFQKQFAESDLNDMWDVKEELRKYSIHYKWFIISVLILFSISFFYVRKQIPKYNISASIIIKDNNNDKSFKDLSGFENLNFLGSEINGIENEIQILKSRGLIKRVVKELQLNIEYFLRNSPYDLEQYPNSPIIIKTDADSSFIDNIHTHFQIQVKSNEEFDFVDFDDNTIENIKFGDEFEANFGSEDKIVIRKIKVILNNEGRNIIGETLEIVIRPIEVIVNKYLQEILIESVDGNISNVIHLSLEENVPEKGISVLTNLIQQYNADGIADENVTSQSTINFLNERLELLSAELKAIESSAQQFKSSKGLLGVNAEADYFLQSSSSNKRELMAENTQLEVVNYVLSELTNSGEGKPLPINIGLSDPQIIKSISDYNDLILERNRILKSSSVRNPIVINIDTRLMGLKNSLLNSLNSLKSSSLIIIKALNEESGSINYKISSMPKNEREYKNIVRQLETKNELYLFLLQRREESILSNAVGIEKAKIINYAFSSELPVSPKKKIIYFAAILLGILIPIVIIYIKETLDTKVYSEKDLRKLNIPHIGDIPLTTSKGDLFIKEGDNSIMAEAFRYVRTSVSLMLENIKGGKIISITSTKSDEGKTFTSINLALSLAISGKKTLLIGMDIRGNKITKVLNLKEINGVTNFILNEDLKWDEITQEYSEIDNLHVIGAGNIPPNPVELLMSPRVKEIFEEAKSRYDYVIVDTAPVGMVSDTIQLGRFADLTLYVVKAGFLEKRLLHIPEKLNRENKLLNMVFLINGSNNSKTAFGYGYRYGNK